MVRSSAPPVEEFAAFRRLSALASLDARDLAILTAALDKTRTFAPRQELISERRGIAGPLLILGGWAARARFIEDGRRQYLSFLLPGDLIGMCYQREPLAISTVVALTTVTACPVPLGVSRTLDEAYRVSHALDEAHLLAQITRLGRLNAAERIGDLLLEFRERLALAGLAVGDGFDLPLTQETLADAVGLTSVHVNRMLRQLRRARDLVWSRGRVTFPDPARLALKVFRAPVRVSAALC